MRTVAIYFMALILLAGAAAHLFAPHISDGFIPDALPKTAVHIAAAVLEALLGAGVLWPRTRSLAGLGALLLMLGFLPLHVLDLFREMPVVGSAVAAWVRLPMQFLLIYFCYRVYRPAQH